MTANSSIPKTFDSVKKELKQVQALINKQLALDADAAALIEPLKSRRGKMLRPALLLLSGCCCGKISRQHIQVAAVVEMLHNATLLHDDVIDDGLLRRGWPTINKLFGNEAAVLLGDFLLSRIFLLCNELEPAVNTIIASTTARLCNGEINQVVHKYNWRLDEKKYIQIITDKSAALFSTCCRLGCELAGGNKNERQRLYDFGINFGIAFQLADDLVDITGQQKHSGKTLGSDVEKRKPTLALIHLLGQLNHGKRKQLIYRLNSCSIHKNDFKKMLRSTGSIDYVQSRVVHYIDKAVDSIIALRQSPAKNSLVETADFVRRLASCS